MMQASITVFTVKDVMASLAYFRRSADRQVRAPA